jgi:hypothetical protein
MGQTQIPMQPIVAALQPYLMVNVRFLGSFFINVTLDIGGVLLYSILRILGIVVFFPAPETFSGTTILRITGFQCDVLKIKLISSTVAI